MDLATRQIQAVWKTHWARKLQQRKEAAILIQKMYRGKCHVVSCEERFSIPRRLISRVDFNEIIDSLPTDSFDTELDTYLQEDFTVSRKLKSRISSARGKSAVPKKEIALKEDSTLVTGSLRDMANCSLASSQISLASSKASGVEQAASEWYGSMLRNAHMSNWNRGIHRQDVAQSMYKNHRRQMGFLRKPAQRQILQGKWICGPIDVRNRKRSPGTSESIPTEREKKSTGKYVVRMVGKRGIHEAVG